MVAGLSVCILAGIGGQAKAQIADLAAPQKQSVNFSFGLGSAEFSERYGGNKAAMAQFDQLIRQLAGSSSARVDSIVVVAYASSANQLGNIEVAERRIDAVKAYVEPVIRQSQLRQAVVVTENVVMKNDITMPQQMFDLLKRVTVTVYMNGVLTADAGKNVRSGGWGGEEQRYISPFGNGDTDVFGRSAAAANQGTTVAAGAAGGQKSASTVVKPTAAGDTYTDNNSVFAQQQHQPSQQAEKTEAPGMSKAEEQLLQQVQLLQQQVQQLQVQLQQQQQQQQQAAPVQPQAVPQQTQPAQPQRHYGSGVDAELQRYIDSLAATINMDDLPTTDGIGDNVAAEKPAAAPVVAEQKTVKQPQAPVITSEDPCPEERDPEIYDLIRRMVLEGSAGTASAGQTRTTVQEVESVVPQQPEQPQQTQQPQYQQKREVVAFEVVPGGVGEAETERDVEVSEEVKKTKVKPVKPIKAPHEPLELVRPFIGVKTNLAYWAAVAANLEVEFYFADRWSAAVEGVYTNWDMNLYKKHYAVNELSPEVRYWFGRREGQYRGLYLGVYGQVGQFDYLFKNEETGNTGDYYGVGLSLGGYLPFTRNFGMELGLRGGWVHAGNYDRYYYEAPLYMYKSSHTANYFGLTGAKVSLVYRFGLGKNNR